MSDRAAGVASSSHSWLGTSDEGEPQLKYSELQGDVQEILLRHAATCFVATDKAHILGCSDGQVHLLDFEGHKVPLCLPLHFGPLRTRSAITHTPSSGSFAPKDGRMSAHR
jgi:hypothetical protein